MRTMQEINDLIDLLEDRIPSITDKIEKEKAIQKLKKWKDARSLIMCEI